MSAGTVEAATEQRLGDDVNNVDTDTVTRKSRQKRAHWYIARELELARERGGMVLLSYCGRPAMCCGPKADTSGPLDVVPVVGKLMAVNRPKDCRSCVRAYEAYLRRAVGRNDRLNRLNS